VANSLKSAETMEGDRLMIPTALRVEAPARRTAARSSARRTTSSRRATAKARRTSVTLASAR
jgi:hypothetical protein